MPYATHIAGFARRAFRFHGNAALALALALPVAFGGVSAGAQPADAAATEITLELNALQPTDRGCRFTFLVSNDLDKEISQVAFELALFTKAGMISRLTIVDFKDLPVGKTKVRQFDFPGVDCADIGRVLVNNATQCAGDRVEADTCIRHLNTRTGTEVVFGS